MEEAEVLTRVREATRRKILFLPHAIRQMSHPERMIMPSEVESVLMEGEVIEHYPMDPRGHSCLLMGWIDDAHPIHVVCSPKDEYLAVITAYRPDPEQWTRDFRKRL